MAKKLGFLMLFLILTGCSASVEEGYIDDDKKTVEAEIENMHALFNRLAFDEIIDNAHPLFSEKQDRQALIQAMKDTQKQYGSFESVTDKRINIIVRSPIEGRAWYHSNYEHSDTTETFFFIKVGKEFKLVLYQIFPGTTTANP